jgi:PAS domain S-box-containing protein
MTQPAWAFEGNETPSGIEGPDHDLHVGSRQLLALLDNTSAVIYMRNIEGRYMLVNAEYERLFNLHRDDIIGRTDHDIFPTHLADEFRANDLQAIAGGRPIQVEETAPGPDGLHTYVTVKFPLRDEHDRPYAVCGISTDITDRKRAEDEVAVLNAQLEQRVLERTAELEASTAELSAFAYSVSHDLRAPLRALHGYSQVLLEDYAGRVLDDAGVGHLRRLQTNATRMGQIIDDLLRLSRTSRAEMRRAEIDLAHLAETIHQELQAQQSDRDVRLTCEGDLRTTGDEQLLRLALDNLMSNAWKFTAARSPARITLGCLPRGTETVFFIRDNGAGFDPRYAQKLFEPFQRLHSAADFEGNGIGLAIVHRVFRRHGGNIWAQSSPDQGATFFFTTTMPTDPPRSEDTDAD